MKRAWRKIFAFGLTMLILLVSVGPMNKYMFTNASGQLGTSQLGWLEGNFFEIVLGNSSSETQETPTIPLGVSGALFAPANAPIAAFKAEADMISTDQTTDNDFNVSDSVYVVINITANLQTGQISNGDQVTFSIDSQKLSLAETLDEEVPIYDTTTHALLIGTARVNDDDTVTVTYNHNASNVSTIKARILIAAKFRYSYFESNHKSEEVAEPHVFAISYSGDSLKGGDLSVTKNVSFAAKSSVEDLNASVYTRGSRNGENSNIISWEVMVNFKKRDFAELKLLGYLDKESTGIMQNHQLNKDTFRIYEIDDLVVSGKKFWGTYTDVTDDYSHSLEEYAYTVDFGKNSGTKSFYITFDTTLVTGSITDTLRYSRAELNARRSSSKTSQTPYAWARYNINIGSWADGSVDYSAQLTIHKKDEAGNPLANAVFELIDAKDEVVATLTTDKDGTATKYSLQKGGTYTLREIQAPGSNYQIPEENLKITLDKTETANNIDIVNYLVSSTGTLEIRKLDQEGIYRLSGATFMLFEDSDRTISVRDKDGRISWTTGADGFDPGVVRIYGLAPGTYYLWEEVPPAGYAASKDPIPVVIEADTVTYKSIKNQRDAFTIRILNEDALDGTRLSGAEFSAYRMAPSGNYTPLMDFTIQDADQGYVEEKGIIGDYILWQEKAPDGYLPNYTSLQFTITKDDVYNNEYVFVVKNEKPDDDVNINWAAARVLSHQVGNENAGVEGTVLELMQLDPQTNTWSTLIPTFVTGANGLSGTMTLPAGKYSAKVVQTPVGYEVVSQDPVEMELTEADVAEGKLLMAYVPLRTKSSTLVVQKYDSAGERLLPNAVFSLQAEDGTFLFTNLVTDSAGQFTVTVPYGNYRLWELQAPAGYVTRGGYESISVTTDKTVFQVLNDLATTDNTAKVEVTKHAAGNPSNVLPGALFDLYYWNGKDWQVFNRGYETDSNGKIEISNLLRGTYLFRETQAPSGYHITNADTEFDLTAGNVTLSIANSRNPSGGASSSGSGSGGSSKPDVFSNTTTTAFQGSDDTDSGSTGAPPPQIASGDNPSTGMAPQIYHILLALSLAATIVGGTMSVLLAKRE